MKADPFAQLKLLDVQELDSKHDQLRHRLATLPQIAELKELARQRGEVDDRARDARILVDDLTREQKRADADVEQVRARRERDRDRMDKGLISNPKDLERMQSELVSLQRRISDLEDAELEVMERLEEAQRDLDGFTAQVAELDERISAADQARAEAAADIEQQLVDTESERKQTAADMPEDLMTLYTRLREQKGGVGAAALRARSCGGCSLQLNSSELADIAKTPSDEVLRCEECNRILVRTSESGI
ncbi:MAG TPA: C4-type zinc ribbon domain-containing protein [Nocardioidaceae bacterium]|nr:C4-type zinc ribbon domain-containing protein [Nocardioidaceae bacterium]